MSSSTTSSSWRASSRPNGVRATRFALAGIFVACLAYFGYIAGRRAIDSDEGYYVLSGRALYRGTLLYRDLFFPQMPLTAVVFGLWDRIAGPGFIAARFLSALIASLNGVLVYHIVRRRTGVGAAAIATAFYCSSILVFLWMPTLKTYGLSSLCLMSALGLSTGGAPTPRRALAGGCLIGFAVSTRLMFAPLLPLVPVAWLLRSETPTERRRAAAISCVGVVLGLLPALALAAASPSEFWFCNVTYHAIRDGSSALIENFAQKWDVARVLLGLSGDGVGIQFSILLVCSVAGVRTLWKTERPYVVFALAVITEAALSALPSPTWDQYFSVVVPLAAVASGVLFHRAGAAGRSIGLGLLGYSMLLGALVFDAQIVHAPLEWRPRTFDEVGRSMDALVPPAGTVASAWPPYLVGSRRRTHLLAIDQYARGDFPMLSEAARRRHHLFTMDQLNRAVLRGEASAIVIGIEGDKQIERTLRRRKWVHRKVSGAVIWAKRPDAAQGQSSI
ncbi:MAG TPA: glycosyltransferase family 39 protein [Polyangiaceae bacterium]